jgi:hypothetical protein
MTLTSLHLGASLIFALAILHTFSTSYFEGLASRSKNHAGLFHLLGEVEIVFGLWALILFFWVWFAQDIALAKNYVNSRNYTEPLFVFAIMVVAASKPILVFAEQILSFLSTIFSKLLKTNQVITLYFFTLSITPLLGSFITEPAAMTLAAILLRELIYKHTISLRLAFVTLGVLFVNISIGGTLTNFAAPPVLMVASTWGWDNHFMFIHFGYKLLIAVFINTLIVTFIFKKELAQLRAVSSSEINEMEMPKLVTLVHLLFLAGIVLFAHDAIIFVWLLLFFIGYTVAYPKFQNPLIFREALLVGFFLAGLVVLGGLQHWWLQPLLEMMSPSAVFFGSLGLTAITDNAALTYLGSLVEGTSLEFKIALMGGAVAGGGLTVIANAPNPAGVSILRNYFPNLAISAFWLFIAAIPPTVIAVLALHFF